MYKANTNNMNTGRQHTNGRNDVSPNSSTIFIGYKNTPNLVRFGENIKFWPEKYVLCVLNEYNKNKTILH